MGVWNGITSLVESFSYLIAPPYCFSCSVFITTRAPLCIACLETISPIVSKTIEITPSFSMTVHAVSAYTNPVKKLILAKGSRNRTASRMVGQLMVQQLSPALQQGDFYVPVPIYWTRYAFRGYNQAEEMASVLARHNRIPLVSLVQRRVNTVPQAELSSVNRVDNVKRAFVVRGVDYTPYYGKHLIIVDDLCTTGSTLQEVARALLVVRPRAITALVGARVI